MQKVVEGYTTKNILSKYKNKSVDLQETFLAENNMDVIKSIVKSKGAKDIKMKDGKKDGRLYCICDYHKFMIK